MHEVLRGSLLNSLDSDELVVKGMQSRLFGDDKSYSAVLFIALLKFWLPREESARLFDVNQQRNSRRIKSRITDILADARRGVVPSVHFNEDSLQSFDANVSCLTLQRLKVCAPLGRLL